MATMMTPSMFNTPPPTPAGVSIPFRTNGPPLGMPPPMFNPNMPPPMFNSVSTAVGTPSKSGEASNPTAAAVQAAVATGAGFQQRMYRFKPTATVNLAEAEGYGRRLRRNMAQVRRHIDGVASVLNYIEDRVWQNGQPWDQRAIQPHMLYAMEAMPPHCSLDKPVDCVTTKFVRSAMNKVKCPIYDICWTPEGRRLVTGASSGEFTLWNGTAFNFETILQAHDTAVRAIKWSHNDLWMISADHDGFIKYWQANMNNVTMFQAHKEAVRSVSFCPSDVKFATASDDGTVRVWDFIRCHEERILRGHGSDVRCVDWHPRKALLVSGSRDSQQPVKLWDPRTSQCLATLHDHKNAVMAAQWNENGNWLTTGSRDHLVKLYDIRMMKEMMTFRGHKKEVTSLSWHPVHEGLLVSGGADGALMFWTANSDKEIGIVESAHEQAIWTLKWHPLGHILASGSNDNNTKFWTRNKAGDTFEDFFFIMANPYEHAPQQRTQALPSAPSTVQQQPSVDKPSWETAGAPNLDVSSSATPSTPTTTAIASKITPSRPSLAIIPGMGLEGDLFEKLREQQYAAVTTAAAAASSSTTQQQLQSLMQEAGGIPGLGGLPDTGDSAFGGRKTLLKQPPPKKAQRQFERVWNVNSRLQGAMLGPADDGGPPPGSDMIDYRKPKPSLLGAPPPPMGMDVGPSQPASLIGTSQMGGGGSSTMGIPSLLATPQPPPATGGAWMDQGGPSGDIWQQQSQQGSGGGGMFMGGNQMQHQQYPNQRHSQPHGGSSSSNFLLPTPESMETSRGGGGQWFRSGGDEGEHGDVDLRQMAAAGVGGWGGSGGAYEDVDYRDMQPSSGGGIHARGGSNSRDPRMQPRTQSQQQQSQQQEQQQQSDYRFQNWLDSGSAREPAPQNVLDRRGTQQQSTSQPQRSSDPRRQAQQQPQSLLSMNVEAPPSNGSGFGGQVMNTISGSRSRSEDQDSDQELYSGMGDSGLMGGGGGRNAGGGAPTNPKRKWKQEYEAEEAQGSTKRWAVSTDEDSPPASFPLSTSSGDRDERQFWARGSGGRR